METREERWRRRVYYYGRHPWRWTWYVLEHEVRHRDVRFDQHPRFRDWKPMYRVSRASLARLTGLPTTTLDGYFAELAPIQADLTHSVVGLPAAGALWQAPLLYVLVRAARPEHAVETGISSGYSSRFLLEALERNGVGHLDSIGLEAFALERTPEPVAATLAGRAAGWLVPERLSHRWTKHVGRSQDVLPGLLTGTGLGMDFFLHDSAHVTSTMTEEYTISFDHLPPHGWLLSHDIHSTRAWPEFLKRHALEGDAELDHDLGVVRIPAARV